METQTQTQTPLNKAELTEYLIDFYNNNRLDTETESLVLSFLIKLGVDISLL